jgi:ArsR family transcriptional regulator
MERSSLPELAGRLAALSHPARLEILSVLAANDRCCCKDVVGNLDRAQSTVSQHLKVLVEAGLVRLTPDGPRSLYAIDREAVAALSRSFGVLLDTCCSGPGRPCAV